MPTRSRATYTDHKAKIIAAELTRALGGDYIGARAANAVLRAGIAETIDELKEVAAQDGEKNFLYRIADLPGVGELTQNRILGVIYPQET